MIPIRVLIVDDSVTIRAMLEQVLSLHAGCQVVGVAADVATARTLMHTSRPDVMTLDLTMPGIDGLRFLHDLQGHPHPPIVVVSSTSKNGTLEAERAIDAGAVACFDKAMLFNNLPEFLRLIKKSAKPKRSNMLRIAPIPSAQTNESPTIGEK